MKLYDCMKFHMYEDCGLLYSEDGLLIHLDESYIKGIDNQNNPLWQDAHEIPNYPVGKFFYARVIDSYYKRIDEAVALYKDCALAGITPAMYELGLCYYFGDGVDKNLSEAVKWFKQAADANQPSALMRMGVLYDLGEGVPHDAGKASYYYELAAKSNHPIAQRNIGYNYFNGDGVSRNFDQAVYWYKRAAENGDESSQGWCRQFAIRYNNPDNQILLHITNTYLRQYNIERK